MPTANACISPKSNGTPFWKPPIDPTGKSQPFAWSWPLPAAAFRKPWRSRVKVSTSGRMPSSLNPSKKRKAGAYGALPVAGSLLDKVNMTHGLQELAKCKKTLWGASHCPKDSPLNMFSKWLGHAVLEVSAIYANPLREEQRTIAARIWK